tara:strand:+ start:2682 stop:3011 length:330 start_codon:yes stop_codon:yes gene_type:complete
MTIEYIWDITQLDCVPITDTMSNYVVQAHYEVTNDDGTYKGSVTGTASFEINATQPTYVAYADITKADAIAWTQSALGEQVSMIKSSIDDQIQKQITPPIVTLPLPWNN